MRPADRKQYFLIVAVFALIVLLSAIIENSYYQLILTLVTVWGVMGLAWNILSGYTGLISFGHAAFFGLGAYTVAIGLNFVHLSPWLGIPVAAVVGGLAGLLIGIPTFRLRGHYFALAMLAYPMGLLYTFEWLGFQEVALPMQRDHPALFMQFTNARVYTILGACLLLGTMMISRIIETSRFGKSLLALKQNEAAAEASGINTFRYKLIAMTISAAITGAIGGFYAVILLIVTPVTVFGLLASAQALIVTMFGGIGSLWGPVIGAAILIPVGEILNAKLGNILPGVQGVIYGVAIIGTIIIAPEGLFWRLRDAAAKRREKTAISVPDLARALARPNSSLVLERPSRVESLSEKPVVLEVEGLSKSFGGLRAVSGVSFTITNECIVGVIGPNGAGKTSLFNLLNGFIASDAGNITFKGKSLIGLKPNEICRLGIGRTFQVVRPFPRMSVFDNVVIGAFVATETAEQAISAAKQAVEFVGLGAASHLFASSLTSKELRLMELARALAGKPKLLLLDETLAGLGAEEVEEVIAVIKAIGTTGITIVIIEHTMHAMVRLTDQFIVLDHGSVLADGHPSDVMRDSAVIEAYLGKKWAKRA